MCANDTAASVHQGEPFPYGSIFVFESWRPLMDMDGELVKDDNGYLIRAMLNAAFVMRKEPGFGEAYQDLRSGEWEFIALRSDGPTSRS